MWPMGLLIQVCEFEYMKFWTNEGVGWGRGIHPYLEIKCIIGSEVVKEAVMF